MRILSIDVGIKNLALCVLETATIGYNIVYWDVINLCEDKINICTCVTTSKKSSKDCTKIAHYFKEDKFFCKTHANSSQYRLPTSAFNKYKSLKISELENLCNNYEIDIKDIKNKTGILNTIDTYIDKHFLNPVSQLKCNSVNLLDIGIAIRDNLDKLDTFILNNIDTVLIENQISPIANRMNCIQGMISQYFIMKDITNILFVSASNKLKLFISNKKTTYSERKKISISISKEILLNNTNGNFNTEKILTMFNKHKKKDDLADCFLQGMWYLLQYNKNDIDIIIKKVIELNII